MCGIAGFVAQPNRGKSECAPSVLTSIRHRGPDDSGWLGLTGTTIERGRIWKECDKEPEVLLLHRRLSILDVSDSGWQPMSTADDRFHLVFNGEIYNFIEIRDELKRIGYRFRSGSDTEVLLQAFAEWGTAALPRFVGMFAFALLDSQRRKLFLARDCFGIKPLFFWKDSGRIFFASEIKALSAFGLSRPRANTERLLQYLHYGIADFGSDTMLAQVKQISPGHFMEVNVDGCVDKQPVRYPSAEGKEVLDISFEEAAQKVRDIFLRNVELHLRSDVPIGVALSGGIDSSSIVMAIRHLQPKAEIHAFSYISEDAASSEEKWVDIVGTAAQANVHKVHASATNLAQDFGSLMQLQDEPFGSTSIYAQYSVFRAAHQAGIKVMLDGQGADEILGGYDYYKGARLASLVRQGHWTQAAQFLRRLSKDGEIGSFRAIAYCADLLLPPAMQPAARSLAGKDPFPAWLNRAWFAERGVGTQFANHSKSRDVLRESLKRSIVRTLPGLLRYEDRNSMAWSVESRVPFLTPNLVRFLLALPESYLIDRQGTSKSVFRAAMKGIVPEAILNRRDKVGFVTPERRWLTQLDGWVRSAVEGEVARSLPFLNLAAVRRELDAMRLGRSASGSSLWRWINLIRWSEKLQVAYD